MKLRFRASRRHLLWLIPLALLLLALAASRGPVDALWLDAPGWSRARLVGNTTAEQAVPIALDDAGRVYLLLFPAESGGDRPRVVALGRQADILWERTLDTPFAQPKSPQLLWDGTSLLAFWLSDGHLYGARLDRAGAVVAAPDVLSGDTVVDSYAAVADSNGRLAAWYAGSRQAPGVYALPAELSGPAELVDAAGLQPALRFDAAGTLHAVWVADAPGGERAADLYYAAYPGGAYRPSQPQRVVRVGDRRAGIDLDGPWLGLDQRLGYLFWTSTVRSGMQAGAFFTQYVTFPLGEPARASEIRPLSVPSDASLSYAELPGGMAAGPRVPLAGWAGGIGSPSAPATNPAAAPELAMAFENQVAYRRSQSVGQVGTLFFQDGAPSAYQLLSFTPNSSFTPALIGDSHRYLYVTWREIETPGFRVYFASSAPDIVQALRGLTLGDAGRIVVDAVFGMLTGAIFAPFAALLWLIAPALALGLTWFIRRGAERLGHWGVLASLVLALAAYWAGKLTTFADHLAYVPFSEWVPVIPAWLAAPLRVAVPALIFGAGIWAAWRLTYRAERRSALLFVLAYAGVDSLLTMAIYGGLILGSFGPG